LILQCQFHCTLQEGLEDVAFAAGTCQGRRSNFKQYDKNSKYFLHTLEAASSFQATLACLVLAGVWLGSVGQPEYLGEDLGVAEACDVQVAQGSQDRYYNNNIYPCLWSSKRPLRVCQFTVGSQARQRRERHTSKSSSDVGKTTWGITTGQAGPSISKYVSWTLSVSCWLV
jgi:hypothetical protein